MTQTDLSVQVLDDRRRRTFSDEEKRRILAEGRAGSRAVHSVCRRYGISRQTFYDWEETLGMVQSRKRFPAEERLRIVQEARSHSGESAESGNVMAVCRRYGISRQTFYNWESRLSGSQDVARLLDRQPTGNYRNLTPQWVVDRVLALRAESDPSRSTPVRISQVMWTENNFRISPSGVFRILRRHGQSSLFRRARRNVPVANLRDSAPTPAAPTAWAARPAGLRTYEESPAH